MEKSCSFLNAVLDKQRKYCLQIACLQFSCRVRNLHFSADFSRILVLFRMNVHTSTSRRELSLKLQIRDLHGRVNPVSLHPAPHGSVMQKYLPIRGVTGNISAPANLYCKFKLFKCDAKLTRSAKLDTHQERYMLLQFEKRLQAGWFILVGRRLPTPEIDKQQRAISWCFGYSPSNGGEIYRINKSLFSI